jgi:hypothetical protein
MPTRPEDLVAQEAGGSLILYGVGGALLLGIAALLFSSSRCARLRKRFLRATETGNRDEADSARYAGDKSSCDWASDVEQKREVDRYLATSKPLSDFSAEKIAAATEPDTKQCGCKIVKLPSKGGSTRYATKCPDAPLPRFVNAAFAKEHKGKAFCVAAGDKRAPRKPFNTLTGRFAAFRRWSKERSRACR